MRELQDVKDFKIELTRTLKNLPAAPLACLCGRKEIAKEGSFLPLKKGG